MPSLPVRLAPRAIALLALLASHLPAVHAAGATPSAPENLAGSIVDTAVALTWDASTDDTGVEGYNLYRDDRYISTVFDTAYTGTVEADTRHVFKVVAFDARPRSFSPSSNALTLPASLVPSDLTVPPTKPTDLTGSVDGTRVTLGWSASTDDEAVRGYNIYRDDAYAGTRFEASYVGKVAAGSTHRWYVVAFDIRTNFSPRSASITLPDEGPVDTTIRPDPPTALAGTVEAGAATDRVTLTWDAAIDDRGIAGYNVYREGGYIATRFATAYAGTVPTGSSNAFSVVAFDIDGNFSVASKRLVLPEGPGSSDPGVPPSVPTGLEGDTVTDGGDTTVTLTWQPSTSAAKVAGYNVYRYEGYLTTVRDTRYVGTVAAGQAFTYSVVAFDDFGNFSARSARLNLLGSANQAPFFSDLGDRTLEVGVAFELRLRPVDLDGGAAGILVGALPPGMRNVDNRDGSRSLVWTPAATDVGAYDITVTSFDLQETDLRTSRTLVLTVVDEDSPTTGAPFGVGIAAGAFGLREGDAGGTAIAVTVVRDAGYAGRIELSVAAQGDEGDQVTASFSPTVLEPGATDSVLTLVRDIGIRPLLPRQQSFTVTASDGTASATANVTLAVTPVQRDDVYLLLGQSNMVGFSEDGAKRSGAGEADELLLRVRQLNATPNERARFTVPGDFTNPAANVAAPAFVTAEDPLHDPVDPSSLAKEGTTIGPGLAFGKAALAATTRNVVLVPAAWAGTGFCADTALGAQWNALPGDDPNLGNTLLFDRAVTRANEALRSTGGILRGVLWLQGEADGNAACAPSYEANLVRLVAELRTRIVADARGPGVRGPAAPVPFAVGTLSRGTDPRGDFSRPDASGQTVDAVHKGFAGLVPYGEVSLHDDLVPANGYPCGNASCIHFGSEALREIGVRFHAALERASANAP